MPVSAERVAAAYLRVASDYTSLSDEAKATVLGAWIFNLRQHVNRPYAVFMGKRPDVRFRVLPDGSIEVKNHPTEASRIDFDGSNLRVLSKSGKVLNQTTIRSLRLNYTTTALKAAGKALALEASSLLSDLRDNALGRMQERQEQEQREQEAEALRKQQQREEVERRLQEQDEKKRAEQARIEQERQTNIRSEDLHEALKRLGVQVSGWGRSVHGYNYISTNMGQVSWWVKPPRNLDWFLQSGTSGWTLPDGSSSRSGNVPLQDSYEKNVKALAADIAKTVKDVETKAAKKKQDAETQDDGDTWSVAWTGYMLADAGEDKDDFGDSNESHGGYIMKVETFPSRAKAEAYARDNSPAYLVKGTQMWNEPLGQVEEHDRNAKTIYIR